MFHTAGEARCSRIYSHFALQKESQAQKVSLDTWVFYLWGGVKWVKSKCSLYFPMLPSLCFFVCLLFLKLPSNDVLLHNVLLKLGLAERLTCLCQCSLGAPEPQLRGVRATAVLCSVHSWTSKFSMPNTWCSVGQDFLGPLVCGTGSHLCPWWIPNC